MVVYTLATPVDGSALAQLSLSLDILVDTRIAHLSFDLGFLDPSRVIGSCAIGREG